MKSIPTHTLELIDSLLDYQYTNDTIPGFTVAIAKDNKLLFNKSYGYSNVEKNEKLTPDHTFRIASHSKTFTATALLQLQEQKKLRIDDKIVDHIDWLHGHKDSRWQNVTIRQLMSHGAGIIRDGLDDDYWQLKSPFPDKDELKAAILECSLIFDNNTKFKYSNFGYSLLGLVVEQASGLSYNEYVQKHIVDVLKIKNTGPEPTAATSKKLSGAYGRLLSDKARQSIPRIDTKAMSAATGFYATAADLTKYFSAQMIGSGQLLSDESKKEMQKIHWRVENVINKENYGLGLEIENVGGRKLYGHGGGFPGNITTSLFDPKDKIVVSVHTNCLGGPAHTITKAIFSTIDYLGEDEPKTQLKKFEGRFAGMWSVMQIVATNSNIVSIWPGIWDPFQNPEILEKVDESKLRITKTSGYFSEGEEIEFTFDKTGLPKSVRSAGTTMKASKTGDYRP